MLVTACTSFSIATSTEGTPMAATDIVFLVKGGRGIDVPGGLVPQLAAELVALARFSESCQDPTHAAQQITCVATIIRSGQPTAVPPRSEMNSRRFIRSAHGASKHR